MSSAYIIELHGQAVGLVVRDRGGYRFHASVPDLTSLEGRIFSSPQQATCGVKAYRRERAVLRDGTQKAHARHGSR